MTIETLQGLTRGPLATASSAAVRQSRGAGFEALLHTISNGYGDGGEARQVAADLLRIEMMQRSLSAPSELQPLETRLCGLSGRTLYPINHSDIASAAVGVELGTSLNGEEITSTAARFLGTPYRFGGEGGEGMDCSSFVQQVFGAHRVALPRTAREQIEVGSEVAAGELQKGDLVFFQTYASYPSHVGIYLGDGKMIHASSEKGEVTISDITSPYYRSRFLGARRVA